MVFKTNKKRNEALEKVGKILRHFGMKLRAFTTPSQHDFIVHSVGCARFTFNFYLNKKQEIYRETGKKLNYGEFKKAFN